LQDDSITLNDECAVADILSITGEYTSVTKLIVEMNTKFSNYEVISITLMDPDNMDQIGGMKKLSAAIGESFQDLSQYGAKVK
jgi:predicted transcriptional regulator